LLKVKFNVDFAWFSRYWSYMDFDIKLDGFMRILTWIFDLLQKTDLDLE